MSDRPNGNRAHDIAIFVREYRKLESGTLRDLLASRRPSPWRRLAIRKVLKERGEAV